MNNKEQLLKELEGLPEEKIQEVTDFVRYLKRKGREEDMEFLLISESSLAEAWDNPIDDEAWSEL